MRAHHLLPKIAAITYILFALAIMILPFLHPDDAEADHQENRTLAKMPQKFSENFGREFDAWLSDHFFMRKELVALHDSLKALNVYYQNSKAFVGRDGWMFAKNEPDPSQLSNATLEKIDNNIAWFKDYCDKEGFKCYIMVLPRKIEFAQNQFFNIVDSDGTNQIIEKSGHLLPIIFPHTEMMAANEKDLVYFKPDHHWTDWGAYTGYQAIMKRIKLDFPELELCNESAFSIFYREKVRGEINRAFWKGHTCKALNLPENQCIGSHTKYRFYNFKGEKNLKVKKYNGNSRAIVNPYAKNNLKVALIGNSMEENLAPFFACTFAETHKIRSNDNGQRNLKISRWKKELSEYQPDILILLTHSYRKSELATIME